MKELVGPAELLDRNTGQFVEASIYRELDQKNFDDFENLWRPELVRARRRATTAREASQVDEHWRWPEKAKQAAGHLAAETFAVECDGMTQGLMLVGLTERARLPSAAGKPLVYVDLLATAPWNRLALSSAPRYKGVGRILIATALSLSVDEGFDGRLGLHSLEQSESWYTHVAGFTDLGHDSAKEGMVYFEATEHQAAAFLADS